MDAAAQRHLPALSATRAASRPRCLSSPSNIRNLGPQKPGCGPRRGHRRRITYQPCTHQHATNRHVQIWLNCDPIGENGGFNIYNFISNNPIGSYDSVGLEDAFGGAWKEKPATGDDIVSECKKCITCTELEAFKRGVNKAYNVLNDLKPTITSYPQFVEELRKKKLAIVGESHGLFNGEVTVRGRDLTVGQQCLVRYFESHVFTSKVGNAEHPVDTHQVGNNAYWAEWIDAEMTRLSNAEAEIAAAKRLLNCQ